MQSNSAFSAPPKWQIYLAFAAIYIIWGSTYLGIRFTNETIPPFLMSGARFILAGLILGIFAFSVQKVAFPSWANIKAGGIVGILLIAIGNGGVAYAELKIPSGTTALIIATTPVWFTLIGWLFFRSLRPNGLMISGLTLGLAGIIILIGPGNLVGEGLDLKGLVIIIFGTMCWALGSWYSSTSKNLAPPLLNSAIQMVIGGFILLTIAFLKGDVQEFHLSEISPKSFLAFGYLIVFGSLIAYSSYSWLIRVAPPGQVSTYAYVNPMVAVVLGWLLGGESLTMQMLLAGALILPGVILILKAKEKVG